MSAPLFLVDRSLVAAAAPGQQVALTGAEGRHAVTVMRIGPGEEVELADGAGTVLSARVTRAQRPDELLATVEQVRRVGAADPRLVVVQGLPKADRGELAVELLTELGVDEIVPWQAERCVTRWSDQRAQRGVQRWRASAVAAAKQSRRPWLPAVADLASTAAVIERLAAAELPVVLHEDAAKPLSELQLPDSGTILLVVGPEGGISPAELDRMVQVGARVVRLGPEVLRTSTAGAAACAVLSTRCGRW